MEQNGFVRAVALDDSLAFFVTDLPSGSDLSECCPRRYEEV